MIWSPERLCNINQTVEYVETNGRNLSRYPADQDLRSAWMMLVGRKVGDCLEVYNHLGLTWMHAEMLTDMYDKLSNHTFRS